MARLIKHGDIWIADLNPGFGLEIHKKRPVLIISINEFNNAWPKIIVAATSLQTKPIGPEKVFVPKGYFGFAKDSVILASEIRTIDKSRLIKKIGKLSKEKLEEVEDALKLVLGMIEI
ncbi:type II toxin-antitoxin system PemK/MazF family toxin [Candidatus Daviesbacteria bacterium]|nr:type II toxin-antitoxin system PemK/MazF family toxin [Candidatus Daviesbacteria bacterium]